ncbi:hypothetical protein [Actinoplanes sp. NPDC049599]|uniref:hypothetical protein n=1 Tax=Actinoplanes sp. NPDC049599 TaxID=3363903 RepID=UPI003798742A
MRILLNMWASAAGSAVAGAIGEDVANLTLDLRQCLARPFRRGRSVSPVRGMAIDHHTSRAKDSELTTLLHDRRLQQATAAGGAERRAGKNRRKR